MKIFPFTIYIKVTQVGPTNTREQFSSAAFTPKEESLIQVQPRDFGLQPVSKVNTVNCCTAFAFTVFRLHLSLCTFSQDLPNNTVVSVLVHPLEPAPPLSSILSGLHYT